MIKTFDKIREHRRKRKEWMRGALEMWTLDKGDLANQKCEAILGKGKCHPSFIDIRMALKSLLSTSLCVSNKI